MIDRLFNCVAYGVVFIILAGLLTGCATTAEPKVKIVEVKVPVIAACIPPDFPDPPAVFADENAAHMSPEDRYLAIAGANQQRKGWMAYAVPAIRLCRQ